MDPEQGQSGSAPPPNSPPLPTSSPEQPASSPLPAAESSQLSSIPDDPLTSMRAGAAFPDVPRGNQRQGVVDQPDVPLPHGASQEGILQTKASGLVAQTPRMLLPDSSGYLPKLDLQKRFSVHEKLSTVEVKRLVKQVTGHSRHASKATVELDMLAEKAMQEHAREKAERIAATGLAVGLAEELATHPQHPVVPQDVTAESKNEGATISSMIPVGPNLSTMDNVAFTPKLTLSYKEASFSVDNNVIVKPVSGFFCNSELVALMGPSGSGKTTLLTMLAAKKTTEYTGTYEFNGYPRDLNLLPRLSGYCPQQEILYPTMTVREAFKFYTLLKVDCTEEEAEERTEQLLNSLQLDLTADTMIGDNRRRGISGGQKRRVHIGKALTNKPAILFLDEPTSGLSSTDSLTVGKILRHLADTEETLIICVIHQPRASLFDLFDHLVLLSSEGRCVYNGAVSQAVEYFKVLGAPLPLGENPADFFLDVVTRGSDWDRSEQFAEFYKTEVEPEILTQLADLPKGADMEEMLGITAERKKKEGKAIRYNRSAWFQFKILFNMNIKLRLRSWPEMIRRLVTYTIVGILFGLIFFQSSQKTTNKALPELQPIYVLVSLWATMAFAGIFTMESLPKVIEERIIYKYDRTDGIYGTLPYFGAMSCVFFMESIVDVIFMIIPAYFLVGYNYENAGPFFFYFATMILAYWVTEGVLMILAGVSKDVEMANGITVAILGFLLLFSGMLVNPAQTDAWLSWIIWLSPFWYGFEALAVNWAKYYTFPPDSSLQSAQDVYDAFGLNPDRMGWDLLIMFGFAIFYRIIALIALRFANNPRI
eukprot:CAMPEP_0184699674 /NCGR_PEP_ID=MMETSP0313-20130426/5859_1 /TAXON_ID=2792 /ORGANISM="Porphyridium aerugineum, Strain SAG 1380-2" /LENGTH=820 /DNA_ID=CAMNT_0027158795 /DNA_START=27 /DNA_END=2489 /DNA_ORIENTATION=+